MEAKDEKWQYFWDLHVMATVRTTKIVVPYMVKKGGCSIIQSASICASQPLWYEPIYNVTKAALVMLGKNMANELIGKNIRVNTINAGLILTPDWIKTANEFGFKYIWVICNQCLESFVTHDLNLDFVGRFI